MIDNICCRIFVQNFQFNWNDFRDLSRIYKGKNGGKFCFPVIIDFRDICPV